mmetsp:Transcript_7090/g.16985  ORF Transcript_7090/g.16985 Transcript_7090/m.16985 type:complete len:88 (+) Transcript_7090:108-371(+)
MPRNCSPCTVSAGNPGLRRSAGMLRAIVVLSAILLSACATEVRACEISDVIGLSADSITATVEAFQVMAVFGLAGAAGKLAHGCSIL